MLHGLRLAVRHLRSDRVPMLGFTVLVATTVALATLAPRIVERTATEALRSVVHDAPALIRDPQLHRAQTTAQFPDLASVAGAGAALASELPPGVRSAVGAMTWVVESGRFRIAAPTPDPSFIYLRIQDGALDRVHLVEGRLPAATTRTIAVDDGTGGTIDVPLLEIILASDSLSALALRVGDVVPLLPDQLDNVSQWRHATGMHVEVVGAFTIADPTAPYWTEDPGPLGPTVRGLGGDSRLIDTVALLAPAAYPALGARIPGYGPPLQRYRWRFPIEPARLTWSGVGALVVGLRQLETQYPSNQGSRIDPERISLQTGLLRLVTAHVAAWRPAQAVIAMMGTGTAIVAMAALALAAVLVTARRRAELATWRARGASAPQLLRAIAIEATILVLPAAAATAIVVASLMPVASLVPSQASDAALAGSAALGPAELSAVLAAVVALGGIGLLVATAAPAALALPGTETGGRARGRVAGRPTPRRLVFDGVVIVLALGGAWLLRSRGLTAGVGGGSGGGASGGSTADVAAVGANGAADPFLAAVPALVGIAAGLLALRLVPPLLAVIARAAAASRGLVPVFALRRAARAGSGAILVVLLATAVLGTFASTILIGLDGAAAAIAHQEVGAPFRIDAPTGRFDARLDPTTLPGVEAAAAASRSSVTIGLRGTRIQLLALDTVAYRAVVPGAEIPAELLDVGAGGDAVGSTPAAGATPAEGAAPAEPIPAIISAGLTDEQGRLLVVGDVTPIRLGGHDPVIRVVAIEERFASLQDQSPFAVIPLAALARTVPSGAPPISSHYLSAPAGAGTEIAAAVAAASPGAIVLDRGARIAGLAGGPIPVAVRSGILAAAAAAALYAALAVAAALTLVGAARASETAHLRVMGLGPRGAAALVAVEHGPTVLVAFGGGLGTGIGLFALLRDALGLEDLLGSSLRVPIAIDPVRLLPVLVLVAGVVVAGVALGARIQGSAAPAAAIRRGLE